MGDKSCKSALNKRTTSVIKELHYPDKNQRKAIIETAYNQSNLRMHFKRHSG